MKKEEFLQKIIDAVEIEEEIDENTSLEDIEEWDSLAAVTTLALFNKFLGVKISASNIKDAKFVGDILKLGEGKYE